MKCMIMFNRAKFLKLLLFPPTFLFLFLIGGPGLAVNADGETVQVGIVSFGIGEICLDAFNNN